MILNIHILIISVQNSSYFLYCCVKINIILLDVPEKIKNVLNIKISFAFEITKVLASKCSSIILAL